MFLLWTAAWAASVSAVHSQLSPWRVFPEPRLRPDWLVPGQIAAQETKWPAVGNTVMSMPHSAIRICATTYADAGDRGQQFDQVAVGLGRDPDPGLELCDRQVERVDVGEQAGDEDTVMADSNRLASASWSCGIFFRIRPLASSARTTGSVTPPSSASSIARADTEYTAEATLVSLIPASWSTFSNRWIARSAPAPVSTAAASGRAAGGSRGWDEARPHQPQLDQLATPARVDHVALAPGDVVRCFALMSQQSNRCSSAYNTGFQ